MVLYSLSIDSRGFIIDPERRQKRHHERVTTAHP
jgi:hypothetical protein